MLSERMYNKQRRLEQAVRVLKRRPYLRYVAVKDDRTSPEHKALHGIVLPLIHPFWNRHLPPFTDQCRCITQTLSDRDLLSFGYSVTIILPENSVTREDEIEWPLKVLQIENF